MISFALTSRIARRRVLQTARLVNASESYSTTTSGDASADADKEASTSSPATSTQMPLTIEQRLSDMARSRDFGPDMSFESCKSHVVGMTGDLLRKQALEVDKQLARHRVLMRGAWEEHSGQSLLQILRQRTAAAS